MSTIRANCPECGDVGFKPEQLTVRICIDTDEGSYTFRCPQCGKCVAKPASRRIVGLLLCQDVQLAHWSLPAELSEQRVGPPITVDDVIDFARALSAADYPTVAAQRSAS